MFGDLLQIENLVDTTTTEKETGLTITHKPFASAR